MLRQFKKIYELLDSFERRRLHLLFVLILLLGIAEVAGVASIMPFMAVASNPEIVQTNVYLNNLYSSLGFTDSGQFLIFLGVAVFFILVGTLLFSAFTHWMLFRFTQMCNYRISSRLLETYFYRPYVWFLRRHSADLGKTVLNEVAQVVAQAILPAMYVLARGTVCLFLFILVVLVNPIVAVTVVAVLGGSYAVIFFIVRRYLVRIGTEMWEANAERFRIAQEGLGGIKDVKVSGLESVYASRYRPPAQRFARRQAVFQTISDIPRNILEAVAFGGMLAILIVLMLTRPGGFAEVLPMIALYAFAGYRLLPALQQVYQNTATLKFGSFVLDRLHDEVASLVSDRDFGQVMETETAILPLERELELSNVSFTYPEGTAKILDSISLTIPARTTVGFVGPTGAGKTTIVDLILGLIHPDQGQVLVDGTAIDRRNRRKWQRALGYVSQQIFLVDDTVAANIAFGKTVEEMNMEAVERAARLAQLHTFIMQQLPDGYSTTVGERGVRLSGGQRQRIGIARSLYHDPSVLILDEATSSLDNVTEKAVMESIQDLGHQKTIIMIAHRLSTVRGCDVIFVMEKGRLVASGTYDELIEASPLFREMAARAD